MSAKLSVEVTARTIIRAARTRCFDAFATAEGLDAWFTTGSAIDLRRGGLMRWHWVDWGVERGDYTVHGRILEIERPERLVFEWWGDDESRKTTVEVTFEERADGTVIRLREFGFIDDERGERSRIENAGGWGQALTLARFWLEQGVTGR